MLENERESDGDKERKSVRVRFELWGPAAVPDSSIHLFLPARNVTSASIDPRDETPLKGAKILSFRAVPRFFFPRRGA